MRNEDKNLPEWNSRRTWFRGEVAVFEGLRYVCLAAGGTNNASPVDAPHLWQHLPR